ncbi:MAG TPA: hypothetical protein VMV53_00875 [Acidimicrobiales bacterium]|nr:hypothetical protein [Acidimicrobiales bacterium]
MSSRADASNDVDRPYPPVAWCSTIALGCVVIGGIVMASYAPRVAPLGVATALLVAGALFLAGAGVLLTRVGPFAWSKFVTFFKWSLLAYLVVAGMIEFAFVRDHTNGASLVIVTLMLVIFALSVPMNIAFTVARYGEID